MTKKDDCENIQMFLLKAARLFLYGEFSNRFLDGKVNLKISEQNQMLMKNVADS